MGGMFGVMGIEDFSESVKRTGVNFLKGGLMIAAGLLMLPPALDFAVQGVSTSVAGVLA